MLAPVIPNIENKNRKKAGKDGFLWDEAKKVDKGVCHGALVYLEIIIAVVLPFWLG